MDGFFFIVGVAIASFVALLVHDRYLENKRRKDEQEFDEHWTDKPTKSNDVKKTRHYSKTPKNV